MDGEQSYTHVLDSQPKRLEKWRTMLVSGLELQERFEIHDGALENAAAAESQIRDVDFASETAELTRNQVLQQAGISILGQADISTQSALSLLG